MEGYADLHVHTNFSDSVYSPEEVLIHAKEAGLAAVGICDHDSIGGVQEALELEDKYGVEVVPGIELSTELKNMEVHMLGYFYDWKDKHFQALLKTIQEVRVWRAELMVVKLQNLGFNISFEEVINETGSGAVGRPHIARLMLKKRYIKDYQEAFDKYLKFGMPAYVGKYEMHPKDAIAQITKLKGIPVVAHMKYSEMSQAEFEELLNAGLKGIEVYHTMHGPEENKKYMDVANKYGLIVTGGSDSHGPDEQVGSVKVQYSVSVERLKAERKSILFGSR